MAPHLEAEFAINMRLSLLKVPICSRASKYMLLIMSGASAVEGQYRNCKKDNKIQNPKQYKLETETKRKKEETSA